MRTAPGAHGAGPGYRATVIALAIGQVLNWAVLYYGFSALVLPMAQSLHWGKPTLMGACTLGLAVCGAVTYAVGAAIDAGRGRLVMAGGCLLGVAGWSLVTQPRTFTRCGWCWAWPRPPRCTSRPLPC